MKNCKIILAGFGGQGILFMGKLLANAAMQSGKQLSWLPSYGPEMRGGTANCHVIIDDNPIGSPIVTNPDVLVAMNGPSLDKFENAVTDGGFIFVDSSLTDRKTERKNVKSVYVDATKAADKIGNRGLANMVMLGFVMKETGISNPEEIETTMNTLLPQSKQALTKINMNAVMKGYQTA